MLCIISDDVWCDFDDDSDNGGWCIFSNVFSSDISWTRYKVQLKNWTKHLCQVTRNIDLDVIVRVMRSRNAIKMYLYEINSVTKSI